MTENWLAAALDWLWSAKPPPEVEAKARELVLDTLGCVIAASAKPELKALAARFAASDPGPVGVAGFDGSFSVAGAAALFAAAACWDEACEGLARAHGRPGVAVIAACSALAQVQKIVFSETLDAIVTGYEVGARAGEAIRIAPGMHVDGVWPALGVAAAAARLQGGSASNALDAVRIAACQMPYSLYLPVRQGSEARNTYLAHSAQLGLLAANAALAGIAGPEGALDEMSTRPLSAGDRPTAPGSWLISQGYLKRYAAVRHVHFGAAAALSLRERISHSEIRSLKLSIYREAIAYCGNRAPARPIQAQFSLSYGIARALVAGDLGPEAYSSEALADARVRALEAKVEIAEDEALTRSRTRAARLVVEAGGERLDATADESSLAMDREALIRKFVRYTGRTPEEAGALLATPDECRWRA